MSDGLVARLYIIMMCMNIGLIIFGGVHTYKPSGDELDLTVTDVPANIGGVATEFIYQVYDTFLGGAIIRMLSSSGMPVEVQYVIATPIIALSILALLPFVPIVGSWFKGVV